MGIEGLLFLFLCAFSFSILDVCRKKLALLFSPYRILTLVMGAQIPLYAIWYAMSPQKEVNIEAYAFWGTCNIFFNLAANLLIVRSLQVSPLSNAIPLLTLSPTFSLLFQPFFRIPIHPFQILAGIIIFIGALIVNGVPRWKTKVDKGLILMTLAALCCGVLILLDQKSLKYSNIPFHGLVQTTGMTTLCLLLERIYKIPMKEMNMKILEAPFKFWLGASFFAFTAGIGQLKSLSYFDPATVEAVKRAMILFMSIALGFFMFKEPLTRRKIFGAFLMALGIILNSKH